MDFLTFLNESSYRTTITQAEAIELVKKHCSHIDKDNYIIRGANNTGQYYIFEGQKGNRESRNKDSNGNYYTVMIDHFIKKTKSNLPLRSASIICTNISNKRQAKIFGDNMYVILPYDDTIIGCVNKPDIWMTKTSIGDDFGDLEQYNTLFLECNIDSSSYESIVRDIKHIIENINDNSSSQEEFVAELFKHDVNNVEKYLSYTYDPKQLNFTTIKSNEISKIHSKCEFWIGGPCVAVLLDRWEEFLEML